MISRLKLPLIVSLGALLLSGGMGAATALADDAHDTPADAEVHADHDHDTPQTGNEPHDSHAAGHGDEDYNKPPISPNAKMLRLFLFSLLLFWAFLFVARKLAWLPLIEGLDAREARVNRALADAEAARIEAAKLLTDHQAQLDEITEKVKAIIAQARTDAEQEKVRIIAEAEAETTAMRDQAIADIHAAREDALSGLDDRIDSQVSTATRHVLGSP